MKKLVLAVLTAAAVFALSQCEQLYTTVQYEVVGSSSVEVQYLDWEGQLIQVGSAASPWSDSFQLYGSDLPFLAFIEVTNYGATEVTVRILEDGDIMRASPPVAVSGGVASLYWVVD